MEDERKDKTLYEMALDGDLPAPCGLSPFEYAQRVAAGNLSGESEFESDVPASPPPARGFGIDFEGVYSFGVPPATGCLPGFEPGFVRSGRREAGDFADGFLFKVLVFVAALVALPFALPVTATYTALYGCAVGNRVWELFWRGRALVWLGLGEAVHLGLWLWFVPLFRSEWSAGELWRPTESLWYVAAAVGLRWTALRLAVGSWSLGRGTLLLVLTALPAAWAYWHGVWWTAISVYIGLWGR